MGIELLYEGLPGWERLRSIVDDYPGTYETEWGNPWASLRELVIRRAHTHTHTVIVFRLL